MRPKEPIEAKPCQHCGRMVAVLTRHSRKEYEKLKFCSHDCANSASRGQAQPKPCLECGKIIEKPPGTRPGRYAERRFCSMACTIAYQSENGLFFDSNQARLYGDAIFDGHRFEDADVPRDYRPLPIRPVAWRTA